MNMTLRSPIAKVPQMALPTGSSEAQICAKPTAKNTASTAVLTRVEATSSESA